MTVDPETDRRRGLRSDARRNQERVLAAATEVFAERGLRGTIPEVAARAGVGKATVYRSYPTKEDLIAAVATQQFQELERVTLTALAEPDAYRALRGYVVDLFGNLADNRLLADTLAEGTIVATARALELVSQLLASAKESGRIRADVTNMDIRILLCGAILQLMNLDVRDPAAWRRYGEMVVNALSTDPTTAQVW